MDARILPAFTGLLKTQFPAVKVLNGWPLPNFKFQTPALALIPGASELQRWTPNIVKKESSSLYKQNNGQYMTDAKLHYFASSRQEQYDFTAALFKFMDKQQESDERTGSNWVFSYGPEDFENASCQILDFHYLEEALLLKAGEIRTEFTLLFDSPSIVEVRLPEVTDPQVEAEIGEAVRP